MRGIGSALVTLAGLALILIGFAVWAASPHSPDLRLDLAAALTQAQIAREKGLLKRLTNVEHLTHLGALAEVEARKRWLDAVRKSLRGRKTPIR